jgi:hypothetical protein
MLESMVASVMLQAIYTHFSLLENHYLEFNLFLFILGNDIVS